MHIQGQLGLGDAHAEALHVAPPSARVGRRADDKEKEKGRVRAVTPTASLIEAYKRQEMEREK